MSLSEREFEQIVADTKRAVLGAIRSTLHHDLISCIDDVAQETYLRIYGHIRKHGLESIDRQRINSWAYVIARNESLRMNNKERSNQEKQLKLENEEQSNTLREIHGGQQPDTLESENIEVMLLALSDVREPYRSTLELFLKGYSGEQIAQELKIRTGTVKSRLSRAKNELRKKVIRAGGRNEER